ncbi:MAG TPA: filamentous hemagglutinin N-terminal domain-containing protein [Limnobacter sp.]|nr:filamentous hemagglutinin N-terminal domain-containing protein [Limnobacter sp.]
MKSTRLPNLTKRNSSQPFQRKAIALGIAMALASSAYTPVVGANPNGMSVVAGQATAQTMGNLLQITNSPGAILNWQQFNIDVGQTTQFIQQNAGSQVFNRVTGGDVSQILGTLQSNGQVFLINPAGVFFGQGAVVDTAGFLASTLAASDTDLLNGHLRFADSTGQAGGIVNQGRLTTHSGGSVVLLAPSIENSGVIHADGEVLLAAGHSVTIVDLKHPTIGLTVSVKEGDKALNLGEVIGKNVSFFASLLTHSGVVEARNVALGKGGVIRFVGDHVKVASGSATVADGANGGGTVHVGGGWQGQDAATPNSKTTLIEADARVSANATVQGDGGEVVAWSDGATVVDSSLQAKGGEHGGDGGRVETSGKQWLAVSQAADTSAPQGQSGEWLIDPANLTIVSSIPSGGQAANISSSTPLTYTSDGVSSAESFLLNSTVVQGLESNNFVRIQTTGTTPGEGNLTVAAPILVTNNTSSSMANPVLLLEAQGAVNINAPVGLAPGQTAFQGFNLALSYDIAKPVYINAPLYLGNAGVLRLAPYDVNTTMPTSAVGQRPADGVNLLSGMNQGLTGPLDLNRVEFVNAQRLDGQGMPLDVAAGKPLKLNVLGANLRINQIQDFVSSSVQPDLDVRVGVQNFDLSTPVAGNLSYESLFASSLGIDSGATVTAIRNPTISSSSSSVTSLNVNGGTFNLNGASLFASSINVNAGGTLNLVGQTFQDPQVGTITEGFVATDNFGVASGAVVNITGGFLDYTTGVINGTVNMSTGSTNTPSALFGSSTTLNGVLNLNAGFSSASFKSLFMGSGADIFLRSGNTLQLGIGPLESSGPVTPLTPSAFVSSTGGQFVAEPGAQIFMQGQASDAFVGSPPPPSGPSLQPASNTDNFFGGALIDLTGLDGRLDTPVDIQVTGFLNGILTDVVNEDIPGDASITTAISSLRINAGSVTVNAGGEGKALRFGQFGTTPSPGVEFEPSIGLDFKGNLTVNSGNVRLDGSTIATVDGNLNVNGSTALLAFNGKFKSADLFKVNRTNGGRLALAGDWDNSAVTFSNVNTASPLSKGNLLVFDDLTVDGGVLSAAGTSNSINVTSDGFLELRNLSTNATFNLAPEAVMLLGVQNEAGTAVAPAFLNGATINMAGNNALLVETQADGVANLDGLVTINSGTQGNLILAGRRLSSFANAGSIPDSMTLNVGNGVRLNVTGDASIVPAGLQLYYTTQGISNPVPRPVFLVGQLTPEAVAIYEYDDFTTSSTTPSTTILSGFAGPSFVIDGNADPLFPTPNCAPDFCVKFDVAQSLNFAGAVTTVLGGSTPSLANSGASFVNGASLQLLRYVFQNADSIMFMSGLNIVSVSDLAGGKRLVNGASSTVRFASNSSNESVTSNIENNGTLELQGNYTFSGLLTGTGFVNNTGNLVLSNSSGSTLSNSISIGSTGTLTNMGNYALTSNVTGGGSFINQGTFAFNGSGTVASNITNTGLLSFAPGRVINGSITSNGGVLSGFASINGNLTLGQGARLAPGASPGIMTVSGDFTLNANSVVDIEIANNGGVPGVSYDFISVGGNANLAGQLNLIDLSGGTLGTGNEYSFLEAAAVNGAFATVNKVNTGLGYTFANPVITNLGNTSTLKTATVEQVGGGAIGGGSTGSTSTTPVTQNLQQAFVQPTSTSTTSDTSTSNTQTSSTATPQEEKQAVETANQSTSGTTVSQQSNDIELKSTSSDAQRPSAVCK